MGVASELGERGGALLLSASDAFTSATTVVLTTASLFVLVVGVAIARSMPNVVPTRQVPPEARPSPPRSSTSASHRHRRGADSVSTRPAEALVPAAEPDGRVDPRVVRTRATVLAATRDELAEGRARVAVHRRRREAVGGRPHHHLPPLASVALAHEAFRELAEPAPDIDTGSVRDDLLTHLRWLRTALEHSEWGRLLPHVLAASHHDPELAELHRAFGAERRRPALAAVARAVGAGELAAGLDATRSSTASPGRSSTAASCGSSPRPTPTSRRSSTGRSATARSSTGRSAGEQLADDRRPAHHHRLVAPQETLPHEGRRLDPAVVEDPQHPQTRRPPRRDLVGAHVGVGPVAERGPGRARPAGCAGSPRRRRRRRGTPTPRTGWS